MQVNAQLFKTLLLFAIVSMASAFPSDAHSDLVIEMGNFNAAENDRFTNAPEFVGTTNGLDLNAFSGIGIAFTNQAVNRDAPPFLRYGTLVSRNVILTANHAPAVGEITFYPDNNPNSTPIVRNITSTSIVLDGSDLRASVLDAPVPANLLNYTYATESFMGVAPIEGPTPDPNDDPNNTTFFNQLNQTPLVPFIGEVLYQVGGSEIDRSDSLENRRIDQAVGQNEVSGYIEDTFSNLSAEPENNDILILIEEQAGENGFVDNESLARGGDSGAPIFFQDANDDLILLGLNSVVGQVGPEGDTRNFSGISYVGNRSDSLDAFIAANAIPEPSAAAMLGLMAIGMSVRRRR